MQIPHSCLNPSFKSSKIVHHVFHQACRGGAIKPLGNHPLSLLPTRVPKLQPPSNSASTLSTMTCSPLRKLKYCSPDSQQHDANKSSPIFHGNFRISSDVEFAQSLLPYASLRKSYRTSRLAFANHRMHAFSAISRAYPRHCKLHWMYAWRCEADRRRLRLSKSVMPKVNEATLFPGRPLHLTLSQKLFRCSPDVFQRRVMLGVTRKG